MHQGYLPGLIEICFGPDTTDKKLDAREVAREEAG